MKRTPILLALILACVVAFSAPACRTLDAVTTPPEVVQTTATRGAALAQLELQLPSYDDEQLANALMEDAAAWAYLEEATGFTTPADLKAVVQSQKIAVKVAAEKVRRGEFTNEQKLSLVQALRKAWDSLSKYYNPTEE